MPAFLKCVPALKLAKKIRKHLVAVMKRSRTADLGGCSEFPRCTAAAFKGVLELRTRLPQRTAEASEVLSQAFALQGECSIDFNTVDLLSWLVWQIAELERD